MGQTHNTGNYFHNASIKENFVALQTAWSGEDLATLTERLKDMTLNFSVDKAKFVKCLQLPVNYEAMSAQWFVDFSHDRASQVVDGLEFISAAIMVASKVPLSRKISLLFDLFDLDRTGTIRKDEFTIFLKAVTTGMHRMVNGFPPPSPVSELGALSTEMFGSLSQPTMSKQDFLQWITEAQFSLHYLSVMSRLGTGLFAWGANHRYQLGLDMQPRCQKVPSPILSLEGLRIQAVATNESHTLFLTREGAVFSCGSGFCGILGHGDVQDCLQPRQIDNLAHARIVDLAVGVRHSVAISEKGQVFTWGSADMGQLGHGPIDDREVHEWAFDPKTGGVFAFVSKPTVVMDLFGKRIVAVNAACCNFTTGVLAEQGHIYTWGNNTDGQCGQGQKCPDHKTTHVDPHMQRTAMQVLTRPRKLESNVMFQKLAGGGYHMMAIDQDSRVWSWGRGLLGPLGHGDQRSLFEPKLVDSLKHQICTDIEAGEVHSMCLSSLYRLTVTANSDAVDLSPFSLLGLPVGRVDRQMAARQPTTPPNTNLNIEAFASAPLMHLNLPYVHAPGNPVVNLNDYPASDIQESVVLMDRSFWEGEWMKLEFVDFDFKLKLLSFSVKVPKDASFASVLMLAVEDKWEWYDCENKMCVFDFPQDRTTEDVLPVILDRAAQCQQSGGHACICILPKNVDLFDFDTIPAHLQHLSAAQHIPVAVMEHNVGVALQKQFSKLVNVRVSEAEGSVPEEIRGWRECREDFTGRLYYENVDSGNKRWSHPLINPNARAWLVIVDQDSFMDRLEGVIGLKPKGVIVCQQSWRPDVEVVTLEKELLEGLDVPIVIVTFEAGEELKSVAANGRQSWVTMEVQPFGGVCAWGNGSYGQLGLSGIENRNFLSQAQNVLTGESNTYVSRPTYVAHLHEQQIVNIACGAAHTVAVTQQGEVFAWGATDGVGVTLDKPICEVPTFVEQLEGLVRVSEACAGHYHSFVVGEMPFKSILSKDDT